MQEELKTKYLRPHFGTEKSPEKENNDKINEKSWRFRKKKVSSIVLYIEGLHNGGQ